MDGWQDDETQYGYEKLEGVLGPACCNQCATEGPQPGHNACAGWDKIFALAEKLGIVARDRIKDRQRDQWYVFLTEKYLPNPDAEFEAEEGE